MSFIVKATSAPKPKTSDVTKVALLYAGVLVVIAALQLFSFEGTLGVFESFWIPGGRPIAHLLAAFVITAEVFALPFLFRMKLSPLARRISMVLGWVVPAIWLSISLWLIVTVNAVSNIGLLGTVVHMLPGWWMVCLSLALGILAAWSSWGMWPFPRKK